MINDIIFATYKKTSGKTFNMSVVKLEREFKYYIEHQDELVKKYNGKFIVIVGEDVVGVFENASDAYFNSLEKYEEGTFMIQQCNPGEESYTQTFHSRRAIFA